MRQGHVDDEYFAYEVFRGDRVSSAGTNISFAVDIDYGTALMRAEGLFEHE
ncbi:MAG: hypothetical protein VBE63_15210 [Lamprobacter sp.]|uniref:hypothetical protein n=1 Tax=Lamprobacter sp. TaxID=3100796 RepID=UPI002B263352|nr:hypothetical protein [Lamprobacter sp.]MEA3641272.1 hypothetical protein [Lamprobacter sp.]